MCLGDQMVGGSSSVDSTPEAQRITAQDPAPRALVVAAAVVHLSWAALLALALLTVLLLEWSPTARAGKISWHHILQVCVRAASVRQVTDMPYTLNFLCASRNAVSLEGMSATCLVVMRGSV